MIGIFDSGIGGLAVYQEIKKLAPRADIIYLSDNLNFPYGEKSQTELESIVEKAAVVLVDHGASTIVVACNSATVSSIDKLRQQYPDIAVIGIEPAVKLAAKQTRNGKIGVLATRKTVKTHVSSKLAGGSSVISHHSPELIDKIEKHYAQITREDLGDAIRPLLDGGVDTIVLGCTHFHFVKERLATEFREINFIEPSEYVAKETLARSTADGSSKDVFLVTGSLDPFRDFVADIIGVKDADIRKI